MPRRTGRQGEELVERASIHAGDTQSHAARDPSREQEPVWWLWRRRRFLALDVSERVARFIIAGIDAAFKPLHALLTGAVREAFRRDLLARSSL